MIRMVQSKTSGHAKAYFNNALVRADDCLDNGQKLPGRFQGLVAERIGLEEKATKEVFFHLCENVNPNTGGQLTQRTIDQRTVGYDINFHCPKSVSIIHILSKDEHVLKAFQESMRETMLDIEGDSKARVRKNGQYDDRRTGELLWAEFLHETAGLVDKALPIPHLHAHCFTFNVTWDEHEKQFKAGQFRGVKSDMPYYQARFYKRLADRLMYLGYNIRRTDKHFEIEGVSQKAIELLSKRTDGTGCVAIAKGIKAVKELDAYDRATGVKKQIGHTMAELKTEWRRWLEQVELDEAPNSKPVIRHEHDRDIQMIEPEKCVDNALHHCFERASVMQDRRILEAAYLHALGRSVSIEEITKVFRDDKRIIHVKEKWRTVCTMKAVLAQEKYMVDLANKGKGTLKPLYRKEPKINLKGEQFEAVRHVLSTTHRVSIIRVGAGTSKTTLMKEAVDLIGQAGRKTIVVVPTADAVRGMQNEGLMEATTVAHLIIDMDLQNKLEGQVVWVDEAGLLGTKDMISLLELVAKKKARLILRGDTRQHSSAMRGDALRILNTVGGIRTAEVSRVYRKKHERYKEAAQSLSEGKFKEAFEKLADLEAIKTMDPLKPNAALVEDYLAVVKKGRSALVISPTRKQAEETTQAIRHKLHEAKMIGQKEVTIQRLVSVSSLKVDKNDLSSYKVGFVLQFNQNIKGIKRGSVWVVTGSKLNFVEVVNSEGATRSVPLSHSNKFDIYQHAEIRLSKGDKIRITRNGFDVNDKRLSNGQIFEVTSINKAGNIKVRNPISKTEYILTRDYAHIAHAYCVTADAPQGRMVDELLIALPSSRFPATLMKEFYMSVSRARDLAHIYTDNKAFLFDHALQVVDHQAPIVQNGNNRTKHIAEIVNRDSMSKQNRMKLNLESEK